MNKNIKKYVLSICMVFAIALINYGNLIAQDKFFKKWPEGKSPGEIGLKVAARFIATPYANFNPNKPADEITYPEVCTWYGALIFSKKAKNKKLLNKLTERFAPLTAEKKNLIPKADHVDHTVFGSIPLELYMQTKQARFLDFGKPYADKQWQMPASNKEQHKQLLDKGLTWQTRMWIDDMYMISLIQAQAYRATGDVMYINRAAKEMVVYLDELQRENGLFYHAPDVPFFWGRGNGWMAAGMTELLRSLPENNPGRPRILEGYKKMMSSLKNFQSESGMWRQLVDDPESWAESSCTGMFTFAIATGVKNGWLDEKSYGPVARKGWLALVSHINEDGLVDDVCEGTNKTNNRQFYLERKRKVGDMHGQAAVLWSAFALLKD